MDMLINVFMIVVVNNLLFLEAPVYWCSIALLERAC